MVSLELYLKTLESLQFNRTLVFQIFTLTVLRHLFPNFDEELRKRDGRIGDMELNVFSSAGQFYRSPTIMYPKGNVPEMFFCSRDGYERLLRHLVVESSSTIRRMAGTAIGIKTDEIDGTKIKSVTVAPSDGGKAVDIPAALVLGKYTFFAYCIYGLQYQNL